MLQEQIDPSGHVDPVVHVASSNLLQQSIAVLENLVHFVPDWLVVAGLGVALNEHEGVEKVVDYFDR